MVIVVFVLGIALGVVATHQWDARVIASQQRPRIEEQLKNDLQLSPDQATKVDAIIDNYRTQSRELDTQRHAEWDPKYAPLNKASHTEWDPKYDQVRQQGRDSIRALLTPEQKVKFEAFLKRIDEERRKQQQGH
ncbi:MAG TPA: Spy/CpxP family protein refolding chaperone [Candidatus Acidoferrales bacterium]|nr:Spy/CpxP family protein refolding chaperone [Candidatus Acidoferrales bacterium]